MTRRADRLRAAVIEEVADIIKHRLKDPRVGFVSVTDAEISADGRQARVFVSVLGDNAAQAQAMQGLTSATGFVRSELASRLRLRFTPEVSFQHDPSIERGARIQRILVDIRQEGQAEDEGG